VHDPIESDAESVIDAFLIARVCDQSIRRSCPSLLGCISDGRGYNDRATVRLVRGLRLPQWARSRWRRGDTRIGAQREWSLDATAAPEGASAPVF
jgi:hypothetical protein